MTFSKLSSACVAAMLLVPASALHAQQALPAPTGTITGKVVCEDTGAPARLGHVILRSATPANAGVDMFKGLDALMGGGNSSKLTKEQQADRDKQRAQLARTANMMADAGHTVTIGLDGTYRFTNVPPGKYQLRPTFDGYVDPLAGFTPEQLSSSDAALQARIAAASPTVTVAAGESAHVDLKLQRGASIAGHVRFEDGQPAAGWQVLAEDTATIPVDDALGVGVNSFLHLPTSTDATGSFRISGLPAGRYVVQARISAVGLDRGGFSSISSGAGIAGANLATLMSLHLAVFSGSVLHAAQATVIALQTAQDLGGVEIVVPIKKLHRVSGHVQAKTDGHPVNFGSVELTDAGDPSLKYISEIHDDGTFGIDYVPGPAAYHLVTHNVQDTVATGTTASLATPIVKKKTVANYAQTTMDLNVADRNVPNVAVSVAPLAQPSLLEMKNAR